MCAQNIVMTYEIQWTEPAEQTYEEMRRTAHGHMRLGHITDPSVMILNEVEGALDGPLTDRPNNPRWSLAGVLAGFYKLPLSFTNITYTILPAQAAVLVLTITPRRIDVHKQINMAFENGSIDDILLSLGLPKPVSHIEVNEEWTH